MLPLMTLPLGSRIAEFEINEVLGEGGFGVVYRATDRQLDRQVALKEYMPSSLAVRRPDQSVGPRSQACREAFDLGRRSFVNEARLLAQFEHPSLARIHRYWEQHGTAYIVMPLYRGVTLKEHLKQHPQPSEAWLRALLAPLMDALSVLHAGHCYHRDIAPDNILLLPDGRPLLLDFGAARQVIGKVTHTLTAILKPGYAPIEQYGDTHPAKQGPWTDIYALSAVLYFAMTGRPPPDSAARILDDALEPAALLAGPRYSAGFLAAVDAGLRVMPRDRPQSIAEFAALLDRAASPFDDRTLPPSAARGMPWSRADSEDTVVSGAPVPDALRAQDPEFSRWQVRAPTARTGGLSKPVVAGTGAGLVALAAAAALWWFGLGPGEGDTAAVPAQGASQAHPAAVPPSAPVEPAQRPAQSGPRGQPDQAQSVPPPATGPTASAPAPIESATPRPAPADSTSARPAPARPKPGTGDAPTQATRPTARDKPPPSDEAACAALLQRASMGEDSPALRERLKTLNC